MYKKKIEQIHIKKIGAGAYSINAFDAICMNHNI